jgi:hypothetical protein
MMSWVRKKGVELVERKGELKDSSSDTSEAYTGHPAIWQYNIFIF